MNFCHECGRPCGLECLYCTNTEQDREIRVPFNKLSVKEMQQLRRLVSGAAEPLASRLPEIDFMLASFADVVALRGVPEREGAR